MKKTIINFVFLFASLLTMIAQNEIEEKPKLIQELAEINIQSTLWDDGEWWDKEDFATFLKRYLACIEKPHDRFKRLCAFKLLKQVDWNEQDCIRNDTTLWHVRPDQTIEYSYKLEPGISDQHVALHVLRFQEISHRFLDNAIERLTTLKTE